LIKKDATASTLIRQNDMLRWRPNVSKLRGIRPLGRKKVYRRQRHDLRHGSNDRPHRLLCRELGLRPQEREKQRAKVHQCQQRRLLLHFRAPSAC